ncbi:MAG: SIMPL domain-containing protein [Planctomycetes bacterium]|nr:SIMPL domain-containing protein [Planctomycetota bacterium]
MRGLRVSFVVCGCVLAAGALRVAAGEESSPGTVTVNGEATVERRATVARILFRATGEAEAAKDALVKYREKMNRLTSALKTAGIAEKDVTVRAAAIRSPQADSNSQLAMMMRAGRGGGQSAPMVSIASRVEVRVALAAEAPAAQVLERIAGLVDVVLEAGADNLAVDPRPVGSAGGDPGGPSRPVVVFGVEDASALRDEAYAAALEDARGRAAALAGRLELRLGRVATVRELSTSEAAAGLLGGPTAVSVAGAGAGAATEGAGAGSAEGAGAGETLGLPTVSRSTRLEVGFRVER